MLDCHRFTLASRLAIERAPEQVYVSALIFSPSNSIVRQNFGHEMPQWLRSNMTLPESWGPGLVAIQCGYDVDSITFLDHGKLLATSGYYDSSLSFAHRQGLDIWDPRTGGCQSSSLRIGDMDTKYLSSDGSLVVSVSSEQVLTLWDVARHENRFVWDSRQSPIPSAARVLNSGAFQAEFLPLDPIVAAEGITGTAFSFDSCLLALGYQDGSVRVVDTQTGNDHWNLKNHSNRVTNLAFSPDATMLAIGVWDGPIRLWDVRSGSHQSTLGDGVRPSSWFSKGYAGPVVPAMVFSPDSRSIATSVDDRTVHLWSTPTGKHRFALGRHSCAAVHAGFSPNSELLATGSYIGGDVFVWDVQTGTCLTKFPGGCEDFSFSPDGKSLALVSFMKVQVWDIQKQTYSASLDTDARRVCFSPDGKFLASGPDNGTLRVWEMDSMPVDDCSIGSPSEPAKEEKKDGEVRRVEFSPDGQFVASESSGTIRIWQSETGDCSFEYKGHSSSVSSDSRMVISASKDGLRLFDVGAKTSQFSPTQFSPKQGFARHPRLSPDGRLVASVWNDNVILVSDIQENTDIAIPVSNLGNILGLIFSPTSDFIASAHANQGPRIWDACTGKLVTDLSRGSGDVRGAYVFAFSPYSELLAFGRNDGQNNFYLQLWDIQADDCHFTIEINERHGAIKAIIFSPDGQFVAASFLPNIQLFNTKTGDLLLTIPCFSLMPRVEFFTGMDVVFIDGIGHKIAQSSESPGPAITHHSCHISDFQIDRSEEWVTRSSKRFLWLPPDRRPSRHFSHSYAVWRNKIAIGSRSGLQILTFDHEQNHSGIEELSLGSDD